MTFSRLATRIFRGPGGRMFDMTDGEPWLGIGLGPKGPRETTDSRVGVSPLSSTRTSSRQTSRSMLLRSARRAAPPPYALHTLRAPPSTARGGSQPCPVQRRRGYGYQRDTPSPPRHIPHACRRRGGHRMGCAGSRIHEQALDAESLPARLLAATTKVRVAARPGRRTSEHEQRRRSRAGPGVRRQTSAGAEGVGPPAAALRPKPVSAAYRSRAAARQDPPP